MTDRVDMEAVVEAVLFVSNDPVSRDKLLEVFAEDERLEAQQAIEAVVERYRESHLRGILVDEVAGGLRLVSRPDLHGYLRRFFEVSGTNKLSMAALETLAVVAYRQPVTAPEIQELRGVNSSGVLKKLLERRLVRVAGRKEVVGKPFLYATTRDFLMHFGLRNLKELPPLEQFEELLGMEAETDDEPRQGDLEEEISQQAAALDAAEDDAHAEQEAATIEAERRLAEEEADLDELEAVAAVMSAAEGADTDSEDGDSEDGDSEDGDSEDGDSEDGDSEGTASEAETADDTSSQGAASEGDPLIGSADDAEAMAAATSHDAAEVDSDRAADKPPSTAEEEDHV